MKSGALSFFAATIWLFILPGTALAEAQYTTSIELSACKTKEAYRQYSNAMRNRDIKAFKTLVGSGQCFTLKKGVRLKIVQHDEPLFSQIEILGGQQQKLWTIYLGK